ncbi:MAG: hypothetical protein HYZ09_02805 [Candidatus Kerfeldbacteria bacterium]|nr:hypothetical protein [Candidatus Kerfeldbacteria bacterium]
MRWTFFILLILAPWFASAQSSLEPRATYDVTARVLESFDDVVEDVAYVRVRLAVIEVVGRSGSSDAPPLGTGTTLTAIVRDARHQALVRSASPSQALPMSLGWFDQGTYEVFSVLGQAIGVGPANDQGAAERRFSVLQLITLLGGIAVVAVVALRLLHRPPDHGHR